MPTSTAGRWFALNMSDCRKHWPSVIEMTLVGMYAETSLALVSMIGRPVIEPPPISSESFAQRSSRRECRRSEERRVGKECRSRRWQEHEEDDGDREMRS